MYNICDKPFFSRIASMVLAVVFTLNLIVFDSPVTIISNSSADTIPIATETNELSDNNLITKTLTTKIVKEQWVTKMNDVGMIKVNPKTSSSSYGNFSSLNDAMWETNTGTTDTLTFDGSTSDVDNDSNFYYTLEYDTTLGGYYRKYHVSTADQLIRLLYLYDNTTMFNDNISATSVSAVGTYKSVTSTPLSVATVGATYEPPTIGDSSKTMAFGVVGDGSNDEEGITAVNKLSIVLEKNINLENSNTFWEGYANSNIILEIDGQGHTIYNGYFGTYKIDGKTYYRYFLESDQQVYIHDLTFSNMLIQHAKGMFGDSVNRAYFENVNFTKCIAIGTGSTTIVLGIKYYSCYFKECTISDCYVYGNGHCSTFGSYNARDNSTNDNSSRYGYYGTCYESLPRKDSYVYYTDIPDSIDKIEPFWKGSTFTQTLDEKNYTYTFDTKAPSIYEDCGVVDSYVYDTGTHSGTFISCARSGIICKRCFTNSTIIASQKTGVFLGSVIGAENGFYYPGEDGRVSSYFEDCYASGLIEGESEIGGFIGTVFNDIENENRAYSNTDRGKVVFNNCYSTSLVGLEYTGVAVGGFIGSLRGADSKNTDKEHIFRNCYAAGEVGDITTDVSKDTDGNPNTSNSVGGFIGTYDTTYSGFKIENCYYDKQTTGMRERSVGATTTNWATGGMNNDEDFAKDNNVEQGATKTGPLYDMKTGVTYLTLDKQAGENGLTGVYTKGSSKKGVKGLVYDSSLDENYNVNMGDSGAWTYKDGYYPQLDSLLNFNSSYASDSNSDINDMAKYREDLYKKCSLASASTVYLDHYDTVMDDAGEEIDADSTYSEVYDTVRDITSIFSFTSRGNSDSGSMDVSTTWYLNTTMNNAHKYTQTFGLSFTASESNSLTHNSNYVSDDTKYGYTDTITVESDITKNSKEYSGTYHRDVAVLTITPSTIDVDGNEVSRKDDNDNSTSYIYKCTDFAPGKQWVTVCVTDDGYSEWKAKEKKYDKYKQNIKAYRRILDNHALMVNYSSENSTDLNADLTYKQNILNEFEKALNVTDTDTLKENMNSIKSVLESDLKDTDLLTDLTFTENDVENAVNANAIVGYCKEYLNKKLEYVLQDVNCTLSKDGTKIESITGTNALYLQTGEKMVNTTGNSGKYTTVVTLDVKEPLEKDENPYAISCTRNLRLLPKDYIDAGSDIKITIDEADKKNGVNISGDESITNTFTILDIDNMGTSLVLSKFRHYLTASYATTSNERLGKYNKNIKENNPENLEQYSIYGQQNIVKVDSEDNSSTESFNVGNTVIYPFAVQTQFPSNDNTEDGIGKMLDMNVSTGHTSNSKTIVKVYGTNENSDNSTGSKIKRNTKPISSQAALDEWKTGTFKGVANEQGNYYMVYYWRLSDGRFLSDSKLVQIVKNSCNVSMTSGILNAKEEPLDDKRAVIDIDATSSSVNDDNFHFPSDDGYNETDYITDDRYIDQYITNKQDNNKYLAKTVALDTSSNTVTVAWRRNTDYILKTLNIEVYAKNENGDYDWTSMGSVVYNSDGSYIFNRATYSYNFTSIEYVYDKEEDSYTAVKTSGVMKQYMVNTKSVGDGSVRSTIDLDFTSVSSGINADKIDKVRCTAYFVNVAAAVTADKYVLIDDGKTDAITDITDTSSEDYQEYANKYLGEDKGVISAEKYREVNDYDSSSQSVALDEQKAVMPGDTLIYRTYLHNDGYYTAQTTNLYETLPSGVHLVDDSVRIYRQYKDTTNIYKYGDVELYADDKDIVQTKTLELADPNNVTRNITYTVKSTYSISEISDNGYYVGKYVLSNLTATYVDNGALETIEFDSEELKSILINPNTNSNEYKNFERYNNGDPTGYANNNNGGEDLYKYKIYKDSDGNTKIDWTLEYVASDYDYFLEYRVVVDDIGVDNRTVKDYESYTEFDNIFANGQTLPGTSLGHLNSNYQASSVMNLVESDEVVGVGKANEEASYTVEANINDSYTQYLASNQSSLKDIYFSIQLDSNYTFKNLLVYSADKDSKITSETPYTEFKSNVESNPTTTNYTFEFDKTTNTIELHGLDIQNKRYRITLNGVQTDVSNGVKHKFLLVYSEEDYVKVSNGESFDKNKTYYTLSNGKYIQSYNLTEFTNGTSYYTIVPTPKENAITYYANVTNTTDTKSTWTYLNLKKTIDEADANQTFVFKVERYDTEEESKKDNVQPTDSFYVDIRCNKTEEKKVTSADGLSESSSTIYYGEQYIVLGKRGYYKVTEITDWSATDYQTIPTIDIPTTLIATKESTDTDTTNTSDTTSDTTGNSENVVAGIDLPSDLLESTALKLSSIYKYKEVSSESSSKQLLVLNDIPTVTFGNTKKIQVWKTGQSYATNNLCVKTDTNEEDS